MANEILKNKISDGQVDFSGMDAAKIFYYEMMIDTIRNYDGKFAISRNYKLLAEIKLDDFKSTTELIITNYTNFDPFFIRCFPALKKICIGDKSAFLSLYIVNQLFYTYYVKPKWLNNASVKLKNLILEKKLFYISKAEALSNYPFYKAYINLLESNVMVSKKELVESIYDESQNEGRYDHFWNEKELLLQNLGLQHLANPTTLADLMYNWHTNIDSIENFLAEVEKLKKQYTQLSILF